MKKALAVALVVLIGGGACGKKAESGAGEPTAPAPGGSWSATKMLPADAAAPAADAAPAPNAAAAGPAAPAADAAVAAAPEEPAVEVQPARLGFAQGKVRALDGDGTHDIAEGAELAPGTVVIVDPDSQAEVDLPDGSVVDLDEMSEVLLRDASVDGAVRTVDLAVLSGSARVHAAHNVAPGSSFRVSSPAGSTEVQGTEYALELAPDRTTADVVVFDGRVNAKVGPNAQIVTPAEAGVPAAVRLDPTPKIVAIDVQPVEVDRWKDWNDRQADSLIDRYDVDIQAPEKVAAPALAVEVQPVFWRPQVELRRARIVARASALVAVVQPQQLVALPSPHARFIYARQAWVPVVEAPRQARIKVVHDARLAAWTAAAEQRRAERAELAPTLVQMRTAWIDRKGRMHQHGHGPGAVVVGVPGAPPPTVVVSPPSVVVTAPTIGIVVPGVTVGIPAPVVIGAPPAPVVVGVPQPVVVEPPRHDEGHHHGEWHMPGAVVVTPAPAPVPPPVVVGAPPPPTIVGPAGPSHHGHGHEEHGGPVAPGGEQGDQGEHGHHGH